MDALVADYGSSSAEETSDSEISDKSKTKSTTKLSLPPPSFDDVRDSVFKNPYIEAENAKSAILEKHVKMIPSKEFLTEINGKEICWMYKKGRCRFGSKCKYAHDTELYNADSSTNSEESVESESPKHNTSSLNQPSGSDLENEQTKLINSNRKKRPGLSQSLVPGKKVMRMYYGASK